MLESEILSKSINDLPVSQHFKNNSLAMGFNTLEQIIYKTPADLMANKSFNHVWLGELSDVLSHYGLSHLIQPTQGNSRV
jgi:DNA-directed RNA polymerase alpha subunit